MALSRFDVVAVYGKHVSQGFACCVPPLKARETQREVVAAGDEQRSSRGPVSRSCAKDVVTADNAAAQHLQHEPELPSPTLRTKSIAMRYLLVARKGWAFAYAALPSSFACAAACSLCVSVSRLYLAIALETTKGARLSVHAHSIAPLNECKNMRMRVCRACVSKLERAAERLVTEASALAAALDEGGCELASACADASAAAREAALPGVLSAGSMAGRMIVSRMYASDTSRSYSSP